jgi:hypothetical protein
VSTSCCNTRSGESAMVWPNRTKASFTTAKSGGRAGLLRNSRVQITDSKGMEDAADAEADPIKITSQKAGASKTGGNVTSSRG